VGIWLGFGGGGVGGGHFTIEQKGEEGEKVRR